MKRKFQQYFIIDLVCYLLFLKKSSSFESAFDRG